MTVQRYQTKSRKSPWFYVGVVAFVALHSAILLLYLHGMNSLLIGTAYYVYPMGVAVGASTYLLVLEANYCLERLFSRMAR